MRMANTLANILTTAALLLSAQPAGSKGVEAEIRRLNAREVEGLLRNDVKALEEIWAEEFVVTNPLNQFVSRQQVVGLIESGTLAFKSYDRQVEYVRVYGDTAVVAGGETVMWAGRMPNAGEVSRLRFTAVWVRRGGRWREVARHANVIPVSKP